nr:hypothetical protein [uncultured Treponema sp.]
MKKLKKILVLFIICWIAASMFANDFIDAAKANDIDRFELLVKKSRKIEGSDSTGINVQLSLVYFSDENFERACEVLTKKNFDFNKHIDSGVTLLYALVYSLSVNKVQTLLKYRVDVNKKVNDIYPIQATQFSTYMFHTKQKLNLADFEKAAEIEKMLLEHGSVKNEYIATNLFWFGNFLFCNYYIIDSINRFRPKSKQHLIAPQFLNLPEYFFHFYVEGRDVAAMECDKLPQMYAKYGIEAEFERCNDKSQILQKLQETKDSPDMYFVFLSTGYNPIAPYQWVVLGSIKNTEDRLSETDVFTCQNPDTHFTFVEFQIKDISEIILVKVLSF